MPRQPGRVPSLNNGALFAHPLALSRSSLEVGALSSSFLYPFSSLAQPALPHTIVLPTNTQILPPYPPSLDHSLLPVRQTPSEEELLYYHIAHTPHPRPHPILCFRSDRNHSTPFPFFTRHPTLLGCLASIRILDLLRPDWEMVLSACGSARSPILR